MNNNVPGVFIRKAAKGYIVGRIESVKRGKGIGNKAISIQLSGDGFSHRELSLESGIDIDSFYSINTLEGQELSKLLVTSIFKVGK